MWNGMLSPRAVKSADFLTGGLHTDNVQIEVTEVLDGFATVVVHFNHSCEYHGKHYDPDSNDTGYIYEYQVDDPGMDEVEVQKDLEALTTSELLAVLETVDTQFNV